MQGVTAELLPDIAEANRLTISRKRPDSALKWPSCCLRHITSSPLEAYQGIKFPGKRQSCQPPTSSTFGFTDYISLHCIVSIFQQVYIY